MAYEYEGTIESILMNMVNREQHKSDIYYLMSDEVAEVYAKAKILNKITDIVKTGRSLEDFEDVEVTLLAIEHELNNMLEDK